MSRLDITIEQGVTFDYSFNYKQTELAIATITGITKSGQAVVTATGHGIPADWEVWVVGVSGMDQINHTSRDLKKSETAYPAYLVDTDTIRLDKDTTRFGTYTSGGEVLYFPHVDLTGYTARMQIREDIDDTTFIHEMTSAGGDIILTPITGGIELTISDTDTAAFTFQKAVYDLEVIDGGGNVVRLLYGSVTLSKEVTR